MEERSFKRAALFGVLGALIFFVLARVWITFFPGSRGFFLFDSDKIQFDLYLIAVQVRINLFMVLGFIAGWAFCLFRKGRG